MRQVARALSWELFHGTWRVILLVLAGIIGIPFLIFRVTLGIPLDAFEAYVYIWPYQALLCLAVGAALIQAHEGLRRRLFIRPLSTWQIQIWLALVPAILMVLVHLTATAAIRGLYGADWPWARPAAAFAIAVLVFKAAYWRLMVGHASQLLGVLAFVALVLYGLVNVYQPDGLTEKVALNPPFTLWEVATMIGIAALSLLVGYDALRKERVGEISPMNCLVVANQIELWLRDRKRISGRPVQTAEQAITHYFWREGMLMPVLVSLLFGALPVTLGSVQWQNSNYQQMFDMAVNLPGVMAVSCGALLGSSRGDVHSTSR